MHSINISQKPMDNPNIERFGEGVWKKVVSVVQRVWGRWCQKCRECGEDGVRGVESGGRCCQ